MITFNCLCQCHVQLEIRSLTKFSSNLDRIMFLYFAIKFLPVRCIKIKDFVSHFLAIGWTSDGGCKRANFKCRQMRKELHHSTQVQSGWLSSGREHLKASLRNPITIAFSTLHADSGNDIIKCNFHFISFMQTLLFAINSTTTVLLMRKYAFLVQLSSRSRNKL